MISSTALVTSFDLSWGSCSERVLTGQAQTCHDQREREAEREIRREKLDSMIIYKIILAAKN